jgi:hypothetical protein
VSRASSFSALYEKLRVRTSCRACTVIVWPPWPLPSANVSVSRQLLPMMEAEKNPVLAYSWRRLTRLVGGWSAVEIFELPTYFLLSKPFDRIHSPSHSTLFLNHDYGLVFRRHSISNLRGTEGYVTVGRGNSCDTICGTSSWVL